MISLAAILLCTGPLVIASALLLGAGVQVGVGPGMAGVCSVLLAVQLAAAGGVSALYRYCFVSSVSRGVGLLAAIVATLVVLSSPSVVAQLASLAIATTSSAHLADLFAMFFIDLLFFVAVTSVVVMLGVLLVEAPIRWAQGEHTLVYDGAYRVLRCVVVVVMLTAGSGLIQGEFLARLAETMRELLW